MENHHRTLRIRDSLDSKVQPQQTMFIFYNKFAEKKDTSDQNHKK